MRIDLLLCRLRIVRTRGRAQQLAESGQVRCNGQRVIRSSHMVTAGDILTVPAADGATVVEILTLPDRRGPPAEARAHYRALDRTGETAIAEGERYTTKGNTAP